MSNGKKIIFLSSRRRVRWINRILKITRPNCILVLRTSTDLNVFSAIILPEHFQWERLKLSGHLQENASSTLKMKIRKFRNSGTTKQEFQLVVVRTRDGDCRERSFQKCYQNLILLLSASSHSSWICIHWQILRKEGRGEIAFKSNWNYKKKRSCNCESVLATDRYTTLRVEMSKTEITEDIYPYFKPEATTKKLINNILYYVSCKYYLSLMYM